MGKPRSAFWLLLIAATLFLVKTETSAESRGSDLSEPKSDSENGESKVITETPTQQHNTQDSKQSENQAADEGSDSSGPHGAQRQEKLDAESAPESDVSLDKRFMRGFDPYLTAFKSNTGKRERENDGYRGDRSKADAAADFVSINADEKTSPELVEKVMEDGKRFMRGFESYLNKAPKASPGKRQDEDSDLSGDKRFLRGFEMYMNPGGKRDDTFSVENFSELSPSDKRFMRGFESYMKFARKRTDDGDDDFGTDKRFMRGFEQYTNAAGKRSDSDYAGSDYSTDKRFMRGFESYMQRPKPGIGKRDDGQDVAEDDMDEKRFMKGFDLYIPKRHDAQYAQDGNSGWSEDKRFMKGFETYLPKRFMKGFEMYLPNSFNPKTPSNQISGGHPAAKWAKRNSIDSTDTEEENEHELQAVQNEKEKKFMKGMDWYVQQHSASDSAQPQRVKREADLKDRYSEDMSDSRDKRFLKGINSYLQMYTSSVPSKRFLKGINPYLLAYTGYPSKRFLKGINPYLQIYAGQPAKRFMRIPSLEIGRTQWEARPQFTKRDFMDGEDDYETEDKRFMRGFEHYVKPKPKGRTPEKRFMKGMNPYLQMYLDDKKSYTGDDDTFRDKRFLKGINPYLQMYASRYQDKKSYWGDSPVHKRFMKGINPYLHVYTSSTEDFPQVTPDKRFIKGPLLDAYLSRLQGRRFRRSSGVGAAKKRFLKGVNPYLQMNWQRYSSGLAADSSNPDKRFLKGVDHYILNYANQGELKRSSEGVDNTNGNSGDMSSEKRFLKGINPYLQMYSNDPTDKKSSGEKHSNEKRFMKGVNQYFQTFAKDQTDKRFLKGIDPYLVNYVTQQPSKRFMRGFEQYLKPKTPGKRFIKGINTYIQNYANNPKGKRAEEEVADFQTANKTNDNSGAAKWDSKPEKKFMKGVNHYIQMHGKAGRTKRQAEYFDVRPHEASRQNDQLDALFDGTSHKDSAMDLPPEKRFLKGVNSYLRHYVNYQRPTRSDFDEMETAVGDRLAEELASTASHLLDKAEHSRDQDNDFRYSQNEATWPGAVRMPSSAQLREIDELVEPEKYFEDVDEEKTYERRWNQKQFRPQRQTFHTLGHWMPIFGRGHYLSWQAGSG